MQIESPFVASVNPTNYKSFADYFFTSIVEYGTRIAIVDNNSGKQWRYVEIEECTKTCVKRLLELGVTSTTKVALVSANSALVIFVQLAISIIGAQVSYLNACLSSDELWHIIEVSECTHFIVDAQTALKIEDVRRNKYRNGRIRVVRRLDEVTGDVKLSRLQKRDSRSTMMQQSRDSNYDSMDSYTKAETASVLSSQDCKLEEELIDSNLPTNSTDNHFNEFFVTLLCGSSRFSNPIKIAQNVVIGHLNNLQHSIYGPPTTTDRVLLSLSFHEVFGWYSAFYALLCGAELVITSKPSNKFILKALIEYKITYLPVFPNFVYFLANDLSLENITLRPHLRTIIVSGAPLDSRLGRQCKERLGVKDIRQIYFSNDFGSPCMFSHVRSDNMDSTGQLLPNVSARILQWENKNLCVPRQHGRLFLRYHDATSNGESINTDGFTKTGDAAFYDEAGFIYVLDQTKEIIRYKGAFISPIDVERALRFHPGIEDCAVVSRQDHIVNEVPAIFVVKRNSNSMLSTAEVRQHIATAGKIPLFKDLRGCIFFVSEIPRSNGKVVRSQLRQYWDRRRSGSKVDTLNGLSTMPTTIGNHVENRRSSTIPTAVRRGSSVTSRKSTNSSGRLIKK
ncbi:hypothetical protein M3Y95_01197500 [Aphelenchoides besseyi]|nr:hypothetical protein M3Y95_01197500 [Aphelenchoides besseyi]